MKSGNVMRPKSDIGSFPVLCRSLGTVGRAVVPLFFFLVHMAAVLRLMYLQGRSSSVRSVRVPRVSFYSLVAALFPRIYMQRFDFRRDS